MPGNDGDHGNQSNNIGRMVTLSNPGKLNRLGPPQNRLPTENINYNTFYRYSWFSEVGNTRRLFIPPISRYDIFPGDDGNHGNQSNNIGRMVTLGNPGKLNP